MIRHRKEGIDVRGKVDARDCGALVDHYVQKTGILVRKSIVVLPPDRRGDQNIERGDLFTPCEVITDGKPLGVLIEHRIYYMDKRLIGRDETMASREQITLEHPLNGMLTQHLHHSTIRRQVSAVGVFLEVVSNPE